MLEKELQEIGLNEKEAKIYLASLELGQSVVQDIAQKADINRATAYVIIESLMERGLMSSFYEGKKQFFIAADPGKLIDIAEQEKQRIEKLGEKAKALLPQLQTINNKQDNRPVVKYYEGKEGVKTMVQEVFEPTDDIVRMAYSKDAVSKSFEKKETDQWRNNRIQKDIKTQVIYTFENGTLDANSPDGKRRKVPLDKFPIKSDIAVYNDKVRIASLGNRMLGIIIQDKEIADSIKAILDLAWEGAEKYQED